MQQTNVTAPGPPAITIWRGGQDPLVQWIQKELAEAERDLQPLALARIGRRVVKLEPVPPYKVNWARALRELASRFDRENIH
jgi:hypothetical protein